MQDTITSVVVKSASKPRFSAFTSRRYAPYLFLAPAIFLSVLVVIVPLLFTFGIAFTEWDGMGISEFVGLANFVEILTEDRIFGVALRNNLIWTALALTIPVTMGVVGATLIHGLKGSGILYRTLYYIPVIIASIVVGRLWQWLYHPFFGINDALKSAGLDQFALRWLSDPNIALYSVAAAEIWRWWGFVLVIFVAALGQIDPELYEAASLDGANAWQRFLSLTLPLLRPTFVFVWLISILGSFQVFDLIFVMTDSGPGNATRTLATYIYYQFNNNFRAGYASAIAVLITLMMTFVIGGYLYLRRKGLEEV
jgi:raffinose/stachyose/melibiose transport system permease protein